MKFYQELKRRNVVRVGAAYAVVGWVMLQGADFVLDLIEAPIWVIQSLSLAVLMGLPLALILSWVFELTPEGLVRESEVKNAPRIRRRKPIDAVILIFLLAAIGMLVVDRVSLKQTLQDQKHEQSTLPVDQQVLNATPEKSIAVLPFVNMSSDPDQEYFSDGVSEEILNALTYIPNLKVAARSSAFQFKGQNRDVAEIGRQLDVAHLLEGSVRTAGNQVRVTAQLIQVSDGFQLWARTFDRDLKDVFAIQDEIAQTIVAELEATFVAQSSPQPQEVSLDAYGLYLRGRGRVAQRGQDNLFTAIDHLQKALEIEPQFAAAMGSLAVAYAVLPWYSAELNAHEAREQARHWAQQALAIEPLNVEAMAVLGLVLYQSDLNWDGARDLFTRALEIGPSSAIVHNFIGDVLLRVTDLDRAEFHEARATELDPLSAIMWTDLANVFLARNDFEKARELYQRALRLDGEFANALTRLVDCHYYLGDLVSMRQTVDRARKIPGLRAASLTEMEMKLARAEGRQTQAEALLKQRIAQFEQSQDSLASVAYDLAWMGHFDRSAEFLQRAVEGDHGLWLFPFFVRLPEQAPDSKPWQTFWAMPGPSDLARVRREFGFEAALPLSSLSPEAMQDGRP